MLIGIDLTWVKPGKNGGTESYIRNLLDGILEIKNKNKFKLFVTKDNYKSFEKYTQYKEFSMTICKLNANDLAYRIIWKNLFLYSKMKKEKIDIAFFPVYDMPLHKSKIFPTVTVIHDLLALHYPQYFSKIENIIYRLSWKKVVKNATEIITTSLFVKNDIYQKYQRDTNIRTISIPIVVNKTQEEYQRILKQYDIQDSNYYYTISSLLPHKNLTTLLKVMNKINKYKIDLPKKLLISGVGGKEKENLKDFILKNNLEEKIIFTGFVSNDERNILIKHSQCFLFPSIFEGFGMPPIEAMMLGSNVLTTRKASIEEVTKGKCNYVDNPFDVDDWIKKMLDIKYQEKKVIVFKEYEKRYIAKQYIKCFEDVLNYK